MVVLLFERRSSTRLSPQIITNKTTKKAASASSPTSVINSITTKKKATAIATASPGSRKRVAFNLDLNQTHENPCADVVTEEDVSVSLHFWYTQRELQQLRKQRADAVYAFLHGDDYDSNCEQQQGAIRAYEACCRATDETTTTTTALTKSERLGLQHWFDNISDHSGMLGMETITVKSITQDRVEREKYLYAVVMEAKRDIYSDCEYIRAQSQRISLSARLFAREWALALAANLQR
jgi:hypothetical protein